MLVILARVGQNPFRSCIVRHWNHSALDPKQDAALWSGALPTACSDSQRTGSGVFREVAESFPCRLLLLAKKLQEIDSSERGPLPPFDANSAVGKLNALFGPEHATCTGELCPALFQLISDTAVCGKLMFRRSKSATTRVAEAP